MALQVNITPKIANNGGGMPTTTLEIEIDLLALMEKLKKYDLLIKTKLIVNSLNLITQEKEKNIYEFAQIYRNITSTKVIISTIVWGEITDTNNIECVAEGVFINKNN